MHELEGERPKIGHGDRYLVAGEGNRCSFVHIRLQEFLRAAIEFLRGQGAAVQGNHEHLRYAGVVDVELICSFGSREILQNVLLERSLVCLIVFGNSSWGAASRSKLDCTLCRATEIAFIWACRKTN